MLFNSIPFLLFAVLFFAAWPLLRKRKETRLVWITLMSFVFYAWWDWRFLFLLIGTGSLDYACGAMILRDPVRKRMWLLLSVLVNLLTLVFFKYSEWLAGEADAMLRHAGIASDLKGRLPGFSLILPVGISFYTFNSLSYTIDLYRGKALPARHWMHFMAFISFFPHLVAGPIIRARDVLAQLDRIPSVNPVSVMNGLETIVWGLFQKAVLADNLAVFVNSTFSSQTEDTFTWWFCMAAFAFQIFFDFNGYSTMARGLAKLCGIHFRLNFNHPYRSSSFREFWRRWHISLSSFFRDYVYIPLGGNRKGFIRGEINRWITMLLSGLWHGANLTFLAWGGAHALLLSAESLLKRSGFRWPSRIARLKTTVVFVLTLLTWVLFRSENMQQATFIYRNMLDFRIGADPAELLLSNVFIWLCLSFLFLMPSVERRMSGIRKTTAGRVLVISLLAAASVFFRGPEQDFIYFQF